MLDLNALQQLSQLKQDIRAEKGLAAGSVRGSQGRFGFVALEDGREAFLAPAEMARVLPGDRVEVSVTQKGDAGSNKVDVELEKLISSSTVNLVGQYLVRGKGHFIALDMPQLNRWIFIPPKARAKAEPGDFLLCKLTRHPFADGKGQARVVEILGKPGDPGIEHKITCIKHNLPRRWPRDALQQSESLFSQGIDNFSDSNHGDLNPSDANSRSNLEDLPFLTIDAAQTLDMDDALYAAETASGWSLSVAIADPSAAIDAQSALDQTALRRANTAYLPGGAIHMLPESLSQDTFSLLQDKPRPALLCHMQVNSSGEIENYRFEFGRIISRHKLSYQQVADYLDNGNEQACAATALPLLQTLADCSRALNSYRAQHMLLMQERDDYDIVLNDQQRIENILRQPRNGAQQIVEEAMLATNRSAGDLFYRHPAGGLFSSHAGFRSERLASIKAIIEADYPELAGLDPATLEGYLQLIRTLQSNPEAATQLAALRLMLQAGQLSSNPAPHLGLGMQHYATVTSPIRRYNDLHNHRVIRAILAQQPPPALSEASLAALQEQIGTTRIACRDLEQWLYCQFIEQQHDKPLAGHIFRVSSQGVTVKLDDWGITGFVKLDPKQHKFDELRMSLSNESISYQLGQPVCVAVERVDMDKKRINFKWQQK